MQTKVDIPIMVKEKHFMEKVSGILVTTMQKMFLIFGVDNSLTSHTDNQKNNFSV